MRRLAPFGLGIAAVFAAACELLTHSSDFAVRTEVAYEGLCTVCPKADEDLRHVPCPTEGEGDDGTQYIFAARRMHFGKPKEWRGPNAASFDVGYDLDCSARPDGEPVLCKPTTPDTIKPVPWEPMPHGIDNSLVQRIFGPLYDLADVTGMAVDLDASYSAAQESGENGLIIVVEGWNGEDDDANVLVNFYSSPGISKANGKPRWDGTDEWDLYSTSPAGNKYFRIANAEGYVAGGTLVIDYRSRGDVSYLFNSNAGTFRLLVHDVAFAGRLSKTRLDGLTMLARADVASATESIPGAASVLSGCNAAAEAYLLTQLPSLLVGAADMPSAPGTDPSEPCDAVSFGWSFDAEAARLGGTRDEPSTGDAGCQ